MTSPPTARMAPKGREQLHRYEKTPLVENVTFKTWYVSPPSAQHLPLLEPGTNFGKNKRFLAIGCLFLRL